MKLPDYFDRKCYRLGAACLLAIIFGAGFAGTSLLNQHRFAIVPALHFHRLYLDAVIPFNPSWVWVYLLYYPFCFLPLTLQEIRLDPDTFIRTCLAFSLQFGFSYFCFVALPLQISHPALHGGAASHLLSMLYAADHGFNSFPSLHVANVTFVVLLFERLRGPRAALPLAVIAIGIAISTVLIKQHYIVDVLMGASLGWISFLLSFQPKAAFTENA